MPKLGSHDRIEAKKFKAEARRLNKERRQMKRQWKQEERDKRFAPSTNSSSVSESVGFLKMIILILLAIAMYQLLANISDPNYVVDFSIDKFLSALDSNNITLKIDLSWIQNLRIDTSNISIPFFKNLLDKFSSVFTGILTFAVRSYQWFFIFN